MKLKQLLVISAALFTANAFSVREGELRVLTSQDAREDVYVNLYQKGKLVAQVKSPSEEDKLEKACFEEDAREKACFEEDAREKACFEEYDSRFDGALDKVDRRSPSKQILAALERDRRRSLQ